MHPYDQRHMNDKGNMVHDVAYAQEPGRQPSVMQQSAIPAMLTREILDFIVPRRTSPSQRVIIDRKLCCGRSSIAPPILEYDEELIYVGVDINEYTRKHTDSRLQFAAAALDGGDCGSL